MVAHDTIVALATPQGRAGVGVVRISGSRVTAIAQEMLGQCPGARQATLLPFLGDEQVLDEGIALFFQGPHSFTGEDVLELQGHGGPHVLDMVMERVVALGARLAKPGEFSERAFLNGKIDLSQAEAVADLIDAHSRKAAKAAVRTMTGHLSKAVHAWRDKMIELRVYVEAGIDFPEEDIDLLQQEKVQHDLKALENELASLIERAQQGQVLKDGIRLALVGKTNVGKSTLLNLLSQQDIALVTNIAGTTRDVIKEQIVIHGLMFHLHDTAGIRKTSDVVENLGIERSYQELKNADHVLWLLDPSDDIHACYKEYLRHEPVDKTLTFVRNKLDLMDKKPYQTQHGNYHEIGISAKDEHGIFELKDHLVKSHMGALQEEGMFLARRRHIDALERARDAFLSAIRQIQQGAYELMAEEMSLAQHALDEITGEFTSDDLLGCIFSKFCIGK